MIQDGNIDYKPKIDSIVAHNFSGIAGAASVGNGAAVVAQVSTLGLAGVHLEAVNDAVQHFMPIPSYWDLEDDIYFRVVYVTGSTASAKTNTFRVLYDEIAESAALAKATTALDTALTAHTDSTTAYGINETAWGKLSKDTLTHGNFISLLVDLSASDLAPATDNIFLLSLEIKYTPKYTNY